MVKLEEFIFGITDGRGNNQRENPREEPEKNYLKLVPSGEQRLLHRGSVIPESLKEDLD